MAEASQDGRPSDGKRRATATLADIRAQTPAKSTHMPIAGRHTARRAASSRSVEQRPAAMKRATSSPLAKDATSLSIFAEIARLIAGPDTPQSLATHLKRWASS